MRFHIMASILLLCSCGVDKQEPKRILDSLDFPSRDERVESYLTCDERNFTPRKVDMPPFLDNEEFTYALDLSIDQGPSRVFIYGNQVECQGGVQKISFFGELSVPFFYRENIENFLLFENSSERESLLGSFDDHAQRYFPTCASSQKDCGLSLNKKGASFRVQLQKDGNSIYQQDVYLNQVPKWFALLNLGDQDA